MSEPIEKVAERRLNRLLRFERTMLQRVREVIREELHAVGLILGESPVESGEVCLDCDCLVGTVWTASDSAWLRHSPNWRGYAGAGSLCISCFTRRAEIAGESIRWVPIPLDMPLPMDRDIAREVLALRKLCGVMREALEKFILEYTGHDSCCDHAKPLCMCGYEAAIANLRAHLPAPAVKPEGPK